MVHRCVEQIPSAYASLVVCFPMSLVEMLKGSDSLGKGGGAQHVLLKVRLMTTQLAEEPKSNQFPTSRVRNAQQQIAVNLPRFFTLGNQKMS